jgi:hypothetical protein
MKTFVKWVTLGCLVFAVVLGCVTFFNRMTHHIIAETTTAYTTIADTTNTTTPIYATTADTTNTTTPIYATTADTTTMTTVATTSTSTTSSGPTISDSLFVISSNQTFNNLEIDNASGAAGITIYANDDIISNLVFSNITIIDPEKFGVFLSGEGSPSVIQNVIFYKVTVIEAGTVDNANAWATGFDLAEYSGLTINNIYCIDCTVYGAWESCFHTEITPIVNNVVITGCNAISGGEKPDYTYGFGYLLNGDQVLCNNTASWNEGGAVSIGGILSSSNYQDTICPSSSSKIAYEINQGNCKGCYIDEGSSYEVVVFSNDGFDVDQNVSIGGKNENLDFSDYLVANFPK